MMNRYISRRTVFAIVIALALMSTLAVVISRSRFRPVKSNDVAVRQSRIPRTVLWAWERPTDLRFINPDKVGVAFLARTIRLRGADIAIRPRLQPLNLPEQTSVIAVVRVESDLANRPLLTSGQARLLADGIQVVTNLPNVVAVQIDFDATRSERDFYREVILEVRGRLPQSIGFSITALASWCTDDDWISDLPIDEAIPMLFRMGPDRQQIRNRVTAQEEFAAGPCRASYGISTDESLAGLQMKKRFYVFNPEAWTEQSVRAVLESRK